MNKSISSQQMMYSVATFITASSLLTKSLYGYTGNETWISVVIAAAVSFAIISMYGRLAKNYPGISLIELNDAVFGAVAGKIISVLYVFYFLTLTVLNTEDLGNFVNSVILPSTPINIIYTIFIFVCAYAVRKGAHAITRYAAVIFLLYIALLLFNSLLGLNKVYPQNLLPVFTVPLKNYLLSAHLVTMLPFCEAFVFLMFTPHMQKPDELGRAMKRGFFIAAVTLLFIIVRDTSMLGVYTQYASAPTYAAVRLIDIGDILTRLDIIYAFTLITLLFYKVSILLFGTVSGFAKLLRIERYEIFILILGALVIVCTELFLRSTAERVKWLSTAATYSTFFLFILPAVTLLVSEFRKKAEQKKQSGQTGNGEYIC